jgi:C1A family cysteine protease
MRSTLLFLFCLQAVAGTPVHPTGSSLHLSPSSADYQWNQWIIANNRNYSNHHEYSTRRSIFMNNLDMINTHNAEHTEGKHSYSLGMNQFGDMTQNEWSKLVFGFNNRASKYPRLWCHNDTCSIRSLMDVSSLKTYGPNPQSVDWRLKGAVTPVKNQGQCGSCWSFSATGAIEGANFVKNGKLVSLSEQQLVDCSSGEGDQGCFGGLMDNAFKYVIQNGGIDTESDYPYFARSGSCSSAKAKKHAVKLSSYSDVTPTDEEALETAVAQQPVSVAIEADQPNFQFYKSGVFNAQCGTNLDHGVLAVGYGTTSNGTNYWIVKNSWGESWGNNGYIWLAKNSGAPEGQCGIAMQPSFPIAA